MKHAEIAGKTARLVALGAIVALTAYWAGARWGPRQAPSIEALPLAAQGEGEARLTNEEANNVRVYWQAAPAVANIVTRTVEYDFFSNPSTWATPAGRC